MPEQSHNPGEEIIGALVADERRHDVAADQASLEFAAVEAGPEISHHKGKGIGIGAWLAIAWLALVVLLGGLAPVLPIDDPAKDATPAIARQAPSAEHFFGVDAGGRDVFARVIWGARNSLFIGVVSVTAGLVIGGFLGILSGYFKGRIGGVIGASTDILLAFPPLILALSLVTFLGRSVFNVTLALAIVAIPVLARISRASTLSWSEREFVTAARAQGAKHGRVMWKEILPNVLPAMLSISLLGIAVAIVAEGGLAIIGAGVAPEVASWGNVIQSGYTELRDASHIVLFPSIIIFLTVLSLNFMGDVVRARFDVREAGL